MSDGATRDDAQNGESETKLPRMLESMGWLTESILIPRKGRAIEGVGAGTLVDLKAQFYLSQEQARLEKERGELPKGRKRKNEESGTSNPGVTERDQKDRLQLKTKEEAEHDAAAQLEKKAELYDQLASGEGAVDEAGVYEVDFLEKRYEQHTKKAKTTEAPAEDESSHEEDEERKRRRELVLEQAGFTKKGRERAAQAKEARLHQQKLKRERLKAAFVQKQIAKLRSEKGDREH